jgi:glutaredoxin-related protein
MFYLKAELKHLLPFGEYVTHLEYYHELVLTIEILIINNDKYLLIKDSLDKFDDVKKMPDYIKKNWFEYNSNQITEIELNRLIEVIKKWISDPLLYLGSIKLNSKIYEEHIKKLNILKNIQRDIKIKNLLS